MPRLKPFSIVEYRVVRKPVESFMVAEGQQDGWQPHASYKALNDPQDTANLFRFLIPDDGREHFWMAGVSVRHKPLFAHELSVGCLTSSLVHPRELFRAEFLGQAAAVIVCHNHPSGDPEPSAEDIALTRRLASAGTLLGVELLDHVILGDGTQNYVSLRNRGVL